MPGDSDPIKRAMKARSVALKMLEPHRKAATCSRAGGFSREWMVSIEAAADLLSYYIVKNEEAERG